MRGFLFIFLVAALATDVRAATNTAASTSLANVQSAVNASSDGDTVIIPAGSSTWTGTLTVTNGIAIIGAGETQTIITDNLGSTVNLFDFTNLKTNKAARLSSLMISGGANTYAEVSIAAATGNRAVFRLDHVSITNLQKRGVSTVDAQASLMDHCTIRCPTFGTGISPDGTETFSSNQWNNAYAPNTTNQFVIEDCVFDWPTSSANGTIDSYSGSDWTMRYCILTNGNIGGHGTDSSGVLRSMHSATVYKNTIYNSSGVNGVAFFQFRGGTVMCYSNTITSVASSSSGQMQIALYRTTGTNVYPGATPCCSPFGAISGTNYWDGNSNAFGWPALDQMGRTGPTVYNATNVSQAYQPIYAWSNTFNGADCSTYVLLANYTNVAPYTYIPPVTKFYQANRDYFEQTPWPSLTQLTYPHPLQGQPSPPPIILTRQGPMTIQGPIVIQ